MTDNAARALPHPSLVNPFAGQDIPLLLATRAADRRDHPFIVWAPFEGDGAVWTYGAFHAEVEACAAGLDARGVRQGQSVLIHLDNCPEILIAWFACARLGAVAVTTNARSSGDELNYFAGHSGAVAAITQPKFAGLIGANCPDLKWIAVTDTDNGEAPAQPIAEADRFAKLRGDPDDLPARPHNPMAPCSVQYTSGTTSRPKGVLWTHANALWGARINAVHETLTRDDVHLVYLPLFHTNAQAYSVLATLWAGGTAVIQPRFSASRFWEVSLAHRCTWTSMVPFCLSALVQRGDVPDHHHYRLWGNGIANTPYDEMFGVRTMGWWGMTETITHGIYSDPTQPAPSMSIGRPAQEYQIAILGEDLATPVKPGETGHLRIRGIRGISLFAEYLNNPEATENTFDEHGFFITGDRVTLLEDGCIQFADRDKDMLKVGGENVAASEVERVIMTVEGVAECAVVGRKHEMLDEVPVAFVLPQDSSNKSAETFIQDVEAACARALADFKRPREVIIVDEFPRSTIEKIHKVALRERLEKETGGA